MVPFSQMLAIHHMDHVRGNLGCAYQAKNDVPQLDINDHIAGWNIPVFNRKYIDSIRGPHFPASYVSVSRSVAG